MFIFSSNLSSFISLFFSDLLYTKVEKPRRLKTPPTIAIGIVATGINIAPTIVPAAITGDANPRA